MQPMHSSSAAGLNDVLSCFLPFSQDDLNLCPNLGNNLGRGGFSEIGILGRTRVKATGMLRCSVLAFGSY